MFPAIYRGLHAPEFIHVICMLNLNVHACHKHVSCNMHGFRTFCIHVTCIFERMRRLRRRKAGYVAERETLSFAKFCENGAKCIDLLSKEPNIIVKDEYFDGI